MKVIPIETWSTPTKHFQKLVNKFIETSTVDNKKMSGHRAVYELVEIEMLGNVTGNSTT